MAEKMAEIYWALALKKIYSSTKKLLHNSAIHGGDKWMFVVGL